MFPSLLYLAPCLPHTLVLSLACPYPVPLPCSSLPLSLVPPSRSLKTSFPYAIPLEETFVLSDPSSKGDPFRFFGRSLKSSRGAGSPPHLLFLLTQPTCVSRPQPFSRLFVDLFLFPLLSLSLLLSLTSKQFCLGAFFLFFSCCSFLLLLSVPCLQCFDARLNYPRVGRFTFPLCFLCSPFVRARTRLHSSRVPTRYTAEESTLSLSLSLSPSTPTLSSAKRRGGLNLRLSTSLLIFTVTFHLRTVRRPFFIQTSE